MESRVRRNVETSGPVPPELDNLVDSIDHVMEHVNLDMHMDELVAEVRRLRWWVLGLALYALALGAVMHDGNDRG